MQRRRTAGLSMSSSPTHHRTTLSQRTDQRNVQLSSNSCTFGTVLRHCWVCDGRGEEAEEIGG